MMFRKKKSIFDRIPQLGVMALIAAFCLSYLYPNQTVPTQKKSQKPIINKPLTNKKTLLIKKGDNLSIIFKRHGISQATLQAIMAEASNAPLKHLAFNHSLQLEQTANNDLKSLAYQINDHRQLLIVHNNQSFHSTIIEKPGTPYRPMTKQGIVKRSLYLDALAQHIPQKIIMEFSQALAWQINEKSLRQGDSFALTYEENSGKIGHLLAGELVHREKSHRFYCPTLHGEHRCYDPEGNSTEARFLRNPLKTYKRISDPFNPQRQHPVLKTVRPHWGTDFAAAYKTPVHATADGTITYIGKRGGFGNFIEISHGQGYKTRYAHMAKFASKLKKGSHVTQDQVIGYVGNTGLSTGNHLHYEIRIHDKAYNPMTVTLPGKPRLQGEDLKQLQHFIASI